MKFLSFLVCVCAFVVLFFAWFASGSAFKEHQRGDKTALSTCNILVGFGLVALVVYSWALAMLIQ